MLPKKWECTISEVFMLRAAYCVRSVYAPVKFSHPPTGQWYTTGPDPEKTSKIRSLMSDMLNGPEESRKAYQIAKKNNALGIFFEERRKMFAQRDKERDERIEAANRNQRLAIGAAAVFGAALIGRQILKQPEKNT